MGLILIMAWIGAVFLIGGLSATVGAAIARQRLKGRGLGLLTVSIAILAAILEYAWAVRPMLLAGKGSWDVYFNPMFGAHVIAAIVAAAIAWLVARTAGRPSLYAVASGLMFSILALELINVPLGFLVFNFIRFVP